MYAFAQLRLASQSSLGNSLSMLARRCAFWNTFTFAAQQRRLPAEARQSVGGLFTRSRSYGWQASLRLAIVRQRLREGVS